MIPSAGRDVYFESNFSHFREPPENSRISTCLPVIKPGSGFNQVQRDALSSLGICKH